MESAIMASKLSWFRQGSFDGNGNNWIWDGMNLQGFIGTKWDQRYRWKRSEGL